MGKFIDGGSNHFRIDYFTPFAGVDSSAPDFFINPSSLADCNNILIRDGRYVPIRWEVIGFGGSGAYNVAETFLGFGELPFIGVSGAQQYLAAGYFFLTATYSGGNATIKAYQGGDVTDGTIPIGTVTVPSFGQLGRLTFILINQIVYLSAPGMGAILKLSLVPGSITFQFQLTILTSFLGCSFLGELSGRLLAFNVWQFTAGSPSTFINYPFQIAWSADSQQYGVWNVLDISGNPTGAGFNNLPDVEDVITGFQMEGPTCYIYRQQGISEMTPLNSGIQPFNFDHMWASLKGIGTIYANSMSQYGSEGAFLSDTDVFTMGLGGISPITGMAKNAIYNDLYNSNNNVYGLISPLTINGAPDMCYILMFQDITTGLITFWVYTYSEKNWTKLTIEGNTTNKVRDARAVTKLLIDGVSNSSQATYIKPVFVFQGTNTVPNFYTINDGSVNAVDAFLSFPVEMIAPYREVTIIGIVVGTEAGDVGTNISCGVNSNFFSLINTGTTPTELPGFYKAYPPDVNSTGITVKNPQLTVFIHGTAPIGYVGIYGTQVEQSPF